MSVADGGVRLPREAASWIADETSKVAPMLWAQIYTAHDATQGYVLPCAYALRQDKAGAAYQRMWRQAREAAGETAAAGQRLATVDSARVDQRRKGGFPASRIAGFYSQLGQSVRRNAQRLGPQQKFADDDDGFRLEIKMISAIAFPPEGGVVTGFEISDLKFDGVEIALMRYFESTYVGKLANEVRNRPYPPKEI